MQAEVIDARRTAWFQRKFEPYGYPSARFGVPRARAQFDKLINEGRTKGYPTAEDDWAEILKRLEIRR
ncbi:hypothetical protein [Streptomyces sp. NBC_00455]|uniref:hypothetical protein n=1 Tax=Streptomyces sp. NBC_00455 TaxID=2903654 RepID=UPI002E1D0CBA